MTVGELKAELAKLPDDLLVIMSANGEGNNHSPLADCSSQYRYRAERAWFGYIYDPNDGEEDELDPEDAEMNAYDSVPCLVLRPVN